MIIENTLFGIVNKVDDAIAFLREHEPTEGYYVAFSGGKDSVVTLDLVRRAGVKHDVHMNLTSVDPIELLRFVREHYANIDFVKPKKSMHQLIVENYTPPTMKMRFCCKFLKEHSGEGRKVITGVRREESSRRSQFKHLEPDTHIQGKLHVRPIVHWSEGDIWEYIEENKIPYCSLYDEGFDRIGCIMCPQGRKRRMERDAKRWPHVYKMYEGACNKAIARRKERGLKTTWIDGKQMMDWWVNLQD